MQVSTLRKFGRIRPLFLCKKRKNGVPKPKNVFPTEDENLSEFSLQIPLTNARGYAIMVALRIVLFRTVLKRRHDGGERKQAAIQTV